MLGRAIAAAGKAPRYLVCDKGPQFWCEGFKDWCHHKGIKRPRYGAIGKHGSIDFAACCTLCERSSPTARSTRLWPCSVCVLPRTIIVRGIIKAFVFVVVSMAAQEAALSLCPKSRGRYAQSLRQFLLSELPRFAKALVTTLEVVFSTKSCNHPTGKKQTFTRTAATTIEFLGGLAISAGLEKAIDLLHHPLVRLTPLPSVAWRRQDQFSGRASPETDLYLDFGRLGHPASTPPAYRQTLQKSRPSAGRAPAAVPTVGLGTSVQPLSVLLVPLPGEVSGMRVDDQDLPLILRQKVTRIAMRHLRASPSVHESAGITRIVQDLQGPAVAQLVPHQGALVHAAKDPTGKQQSLVLKVLHGSVCRSRAIVGFEEQADRLLYLAVRVEDHAILTIVNESRRKPDLQPAPSRFVQQPAPQASMQHVQFRFTHRSL